MEINGMSKGLEAFRQLLDCPTEIALIKKSGKPSGMIVRVKLFNNGEYQEQLSVIEKELKAFEIIMRLINQNGDYELIDDEGIYLIRVGNNAQKYLMAMVLKKEEYELLKEVLS